MRDQEWLEQLFKSVWTAHFADVEEVTPVKVMFGRNAKTRLGSLRFYPDENHTVLRVNGLFRYKDVPEMVVKATIVHELCHYSHGFHSGLPQKYSYPHSGGVIRKEFAERNLEELYLRQRRWLKSNWRDIVQQYLPHKIRRRKKLLRYF